MPGDPISSLTTGVPLATDLIPATDPLDSTQAPTGTTKKYVRGDVLAWTISALGGTVSGIADVATTAALTATYNNGTAGVGATLTNSGALTQLFIDTTLLMPGNIVLVKNQAAPAQNGIYVVTVAGSASVAWVLTRVTYYDQPSEVIQNGYVVVNEGTVNGNKVFMQLSAQPTTIGTDPITFGLATLVFSGIWPVTSGGTGRTSLTSNALLFGDGTNPVGMQTTGTGVLNALGGNLNESGGLASSNNPAFTGLQTLPSNTGSFTEFKIVKQLSGSSTTTPATFAQITVPAGEYFIGIELFSITTRAPVAGVGTSQLRKTYLSITRNGSGSNVVLDANMGADTVGTSTTGGGINHVIDGAISIVRDGSEPNTDPQVVNLQAIVGTTGNNAARFIAEVKLLVAGSLTGLVIA